MTLTPALESGRPRPDRPDGRLRRRRETGFPFPERGATLDRFVAESPIMARRSRPDRRSTGLPDHIPDRPRVLFVGINPGLRSAAVGHHFAGHGNRFWSLFYEGGMVPERLGWADDVRLPEFGFGITNLCARPIARGRAGVEHPDRDGETARPSFRSEPNRPVPPHIPAASSRPATARAEGLFSRGIKLCSRK